MLWYIGIALIAAVVIFILWYKDDGYDGAGFIAGASLFLGATVGYAALLVFGFLGALVVHPTFHEDCTNLVAMSDGSSTSGSFFLGSGTIKNDQVYSYYYKDGAGFKRDYQYADRSTIYYTEGAPRICALDSDHSIWTYPIIPEYTTDGYNFYVPAGSIKQDFTLNNQN